MKVLILSTYDTGGAGSAAVKLHEFLLEHSVESKILFLDQRTDIPHSDSMIAYEGRGNSRSKVQRGIAVARRKYYLNKIKGLPHSTDNFSFPFSSFHVEEHPFYKEADIIHLHWVVNLVDIESFFKVNKKPIVWTFHDMNPYSGGYHFDHAFPLDKYQALMKKNIRLKKNAYRNQDIHGVCLSNLQMDQVKDHPLGLLFKSVTRIHHGVSVQATNTISPEQAKAQLGVPYDSKTLLLAAHSFSRFSKGSSIAIEAINALSDADDNPLTLMIAGHGGKAIEKSITNPMVKKIIQVGYVAIPELMDLIYKAADVYVNPSLAESFSLTTMEALKNGAPVVGFQVGAIPEMIVDDFNGYLCDTGNVNDLTTSIYRALRSDFNAERISADLQKRFNLEDNYREYIDLYNKVLDSNN